MVVRNMFVKILKKNSNGSVHYYASLVENHKVNGKVVQKVVRNLGPVTEDQIPYLKAAWAKNKPKLVYDELSIKEK
jgi:predicted ATPase